jgi:hypothetical protein
MIPLYGFLEGDTLGLLILAMPEDTMAELAGKLESAAELRVARKKKPAVVYHGAVVAPGATVANTRMTALDRVDVVEEAE